MHITLGFDQWISCIAYCAIYCYATSVHSMAISLVNTRYIFSKSTLAWHSTFWMVSDRDVWRGSRRAPSSGHDVTGPDMIVLNLQHAHVGSGRDRP